MADPPLYDNPASMLPDQRPPAVRYLAVLGLLLAVFGLSCSAWGLLDLDAVVGSLQDVDVAPPGAGLLVFSAAAVLLSLILFIASIGSLYLKPWARPLMILFGVTGMVFGVAGVLPVLGWYFGIIGDRAPQVRGIGGCFALVTWAMQVVYAAVVLYWMNQPEVKAAFRQSRIQPEIEP